MKNSTRVAKFLTSILLAVITFKIFSFYIDPRIVLGFFALGIFATILAPNKKPNGIMALTTFYEPSALNVGQMKLMGMFESSMMKAYEPQTYLAFRKSGQIMMPDYKMLRTREDRPLAAYVPIRSSRALGSGRSYNATGATSSTTSLVPSFLTYSDTFSLSLKLMGDNVYTWAEAYAHELLNLFKNFAEGNETNATNYLYNNRSAYNIAVANGAFNGVNNVFEISDAVYGPQSMQITKSMMGENRWGNTPLMIFCDAISFNRFGYLAQQGDGNFQNTTFQFAGATYILSYELTAKAQALGYNKGFWFAVPEGTISVLDWIPSENVKGVELVPQKWYSIMNPQDGLTYAMYSWYVGTDTFTGSVTQDAELNYQVSMDLAYEYAPMPNANETPIQAVALV